MNLRLRSNALMAIAEQIVVGLNFFIVYAVLIRWAGAEQVGVLSLVLVLNSAGQLANIGFGSALLRFLPMHEGRGDREHSIAYVETAVICCAVFYAILLAAAYWPFQQLVTAQAGPEHTDTVRAMMLPATLNVLAMGIGAVTTSALSALMRNDLRTIANVVGGLLCLAVVFVGTPPFGIQAAFWAMAAQALLVLVMTWGMLLRQLPGLHAWPRRFERRALRGLLGFGFKLQLQSLLVMALEPLSRLLIGHFGTLTQVTYFSMAARYVIQMRGIVYSAGQPMLSAFTFLREREPERQAQLYTAFASLIGLASVAVLSATAGAAPFVAEIWIGQRERSFELYVAIQSIGWLGVTMILASYFNAYSLGYLKYNLGSHIVMAIANLALGLLLGWLFGTLGVVVALTIALLLAGMIMGIGNARYAPGTHSRRLLWLEAAIVVIGVLAAGAAIAVYHGLRPSWPALACGLASGFAWLVIMTPALIVHPERRRMIEMLRMRRGRPG